LFVFSFSFFGGSDMKTLLPVVFVFLVVLYWRLTQRNKDGI